MSAGKVLLIVAHEGFQPIEYHDTKKIVEEAGFTVITASDKAGTATDSEGKTIAVDLTLSHVKVAHYAGIFFIGGPGALEHLDNKSSYRIIKEAVQKYLPVGAICISTRILVKANALTRKRATGWNGDNELEKLYALYDVIYLPEPVVVADNIITAIGPSAAKIFGQEIISLINSNKGWG